MRKVQIVNRHGEPYLQIDAYAIMMENNSVTILTRKAKNELRYYRPRTVECMKERMDKKLIYKDDIVDESIERTGGYFEGYYKDYKWISWVLHDGDKFIILDSTNNDSKFTMKKEEEIV